MKKEQLYKIFQENVAKKLINHNFKKEIDSFSFQNKFEDKLCRVGYRFLDYEPNFYLDSFYPSIRFNKIEEILTPLFVKYEIYAKGYNYYESKTILLSLRDKKLQEVYRKIRKTKITEKGDLERILEIVNKYIDKKIIPFFERYKRLRNIEQTLLEMETKDQVKFLGGYTFLLRRMVIMNLVNNRETYTKYKQEAKDIYASRKNESKEDMNYYNTFIELVDLLEEDNLKELI